ncbi:MAG: flagellar basal body L-ring protein FlgH [Xanthomonadales bacterium]|nr:flagellar basal body L-ring protein FlgH [Xanthomonadales bacterium]
MKHVLILLLLLTLVACAGPRPVKTPPAQPAPPALNVPHNTYQDGAVYSPATSMVLFEDVTARRIGEVLTVILSERTDASKSATTSSEKETGFGVDAGPLFGTDISSSTMGSSKEFEGSGSSSQNNRLSGSVTVVVVDVLPTGLLAIQGEKWITINQGREYLSIFGYIRAADVQSDNTVSSTKIANAQIAYSGTGALADANREGWLTRFFGSLLSPL